MMSLLLYAKVPVMVAIPLGLACDGILVFCMYQLGKV
jgi:hypothetical protein